MPIHAGLSQATLKRCRRHGIDNFTELAEHTEHSLSNLNFSRDSIDEIRKALLDIFGLKLKSPAPCREPIILTQKEFDDLDDYSCSIPSGTYVGKRWKRRDKYMEEAGATWTMGEYFDCGSEKRIGINWRPIIVANSETVAQELVRMFLGEAQ